MGVQPLDCEGRIITLKYQDFFVVNAYIPRSQEKLGRQYYRMDWDRAFRSYIIRLQESRPVIIGGDFNAARTNIDIYEENIHNEKAPQGFTADEREGIERIIEAGFLDTFRCLYPEAEGKYTWWSNRLNKRGENKGWRIDYIFASESFRPRIKDVIIHSEVHGSDHCPVELVLG